MSDRAHLTRYEIASFLAGKAIAASTAFLQGRSDAEALARDADQLSGELLLIADDPACNAIADPTQLLVKVMMRSAIATGPLNQDWCLIMLAFVGLLRRQVAEMRMGDGFDTMTGQPR